MTSQAVSSRAMAARRSSLAHKHGDEGREIYESAVSHMIAAVERSPLETEPFPHFFVAGLFPRDIYEEMLAELPEPALYEAFSYEKHATDGESNRGRFTLDRQSLDRLSGRQRSLWLAIRDALGSPEFKTAVFRRLSVGLAYRFGVSPAEASQTPGYPLPELFRETRGYAIKPHPDTRRKLVTMQIALPADDSQRHLGTEFYRRSVNPLSLLREPRGFDIALQAPFLPNAAYAFTVLNTIRRKSWHGRTTLAGEVGVRNSILNIWYAKPEDGNADLVEQYYRGE